MIVRIMGGGGSNFSLSCGWKASFCLTLLAITWHYGQGQYIKDSVGALSSSAPADGKRDRGKLEEEYRHKKCSLCNRHLVLSGEQWKPFMNFDKDSVLLPGSLMLNVIEYLQKSLNFTWELRRPPDQGWGHQYENGSWSGMIGMLLANEIDFAVGKTTPSNIVFYLLHNYICT